MCVEGGKKVEAQRSWRLFGLVCHLGPIPGCFLTLAKYLDGVLRHRTQRDDPLCFSVTAVQIMFFFGAGH